METDLILRLGGFMNPGAEKRQYQHRRMPFQKPVEIYAVFPSHFEDSEEGALSGLSQDISGGGLCLKTPQPLRVGSYLKLRFDMSRDQIVEAFGKIVWASGRLADSTFSRSPKCPKATSRISSTAFNRVNPLFFPMAAGRRQRVLCVPSQ